MTDAASRKENPGRGSRPLRVHMLSGSKEYRSEEVLDRFARTELDTRGIHWTLSRGVERGTHFPDLNRLDDADVMLVFCKRMELPADQLARIQGWCAAARPVIGIRTASHAFQNWLAFDHDILGGDYSDHGEQDERIQIHRVTDHPLIEGVQEWERPGKLYRNPHLVRNAVILLRGVPSIGEPQPVAWVRTYNDKGGRAFYTSLGYAYDFENANFRTMLLNALFTLGACVSRRPLRVSVGCMGPEVRRD